MRRTSRERAHFTLIFAVVYALLLAFIPLTASAQGTGSSLLVKLVNGLSPELQADVIARNGGVERSVIPALRLHVIDVLPSELAAVRANYQADPRVVSVEENRTRVWEAVPADPLYGYQWALPKIAWDQVFGNVTPTGTAKVALLDTGVDALHPDLAGKVVPGTSILDGSNGMIDPSGHGTWLAGIIAAQTDNVPVEGIAGVAYAGVTVMPVTVLNVNGEGQDSDVIAGVIWAADHWADVILMAFSNPGFSPNLQDAIDYAWSKGIVLVAAVGNGAVSDATFPAGDRGVMGVAATDANDALAYFSNDGQAVFIAAPGVAISTTDISDAYVTVSGTSTSAAIVAGAAAFMKAVDPTLTNGIIVGRLARNADPAGTQSQTGNGRINLARALADTSTEFIEPAGAAPVGAGGPFVGPYRAAATNIDSISVGAQSGTVTYGTPGSVTFVVTVNGNGNGNINIGVSGLPSGASFSPASKSSCNANKHDASGCDFTLTITTTSPTPAGSFTFTVQVTGDNGPPRSNTGVLTVSKAALTVTADNQSRQYGNTDPTFTATFTGFKNGETLATSGVTGSPSLTTTATPSSPVGGSPYGITAALGTLASSKYSFTFVNGQLAVTKATLTVTADNKSRAYGAANPTFTATITGFKNSETLATSGVSGSPSVTATATPSSPVSGSPYTIMAALGTLNAGNYTFAFVNGQLTVTGATLTVTADDKTREYGNPNPTFTATITGFQNGETLATSGVTGGPSLTTTATTTSSVSGSPYTITAAVGTLASSNYTFTFVNGQLTITKATLTVTAGNQSRAYGATNPTFMASYFGFKNGETLATSGVTGSPSLTTTATPSSSVSGSPYTITAALGTLAATNYSFTFVNGQLTVTGATLMVVADNKSREYGDADPSFTATITGFQNGETLATSGVTGGPACSTTATSTSSVAGSPYPITCSIGTLAASNYAFAFAAGQLTITKASLTVTADNKSREYGDANPTFSASYAGFKNGETLATSGVTGSPSLTTTATSTSSVSGSSYMITASLGTLAASNYTFTFVNGQLTITKATLTVTADNKIREYGDPNPTLTASYSGFKNGETFPTSGVTGSPSLTTTATASSTVSGGPYTIIAAIGNLAAGNYQFTFVNGQLTLTKATLTVAADNATRAYGAANPTFTANYSGFKNGETLGTSGVTGSPSLVTTATASSGVAGSPYTITATIGTLTAANYQFSFLNGQLTVTKADPIVTAIGNTCTYNGSPCPGGGSAKGVFGEDLTPVTLAYAVTPGPGNLLTSAPSAAGTYSVAVRYAGDANYNPKQSVPAVITINKKSASVTPDGKTKMYGSGDPALTGTLTGFVAADGITATYTRTAGENVAGSPYAISATLSPATALVNYDITYNTASFTITKADPIVTATGNTCTYNGSPCPGSGSAKGVFGEDLTPVTLAYAVTPGPGNLLTSAPSAAGTYSVAARYAGDSNYNAKQSASAAITINKKAASVTPDAKTKTYGGADPALTGTLSGFVAADGVTATYSRTAGETVAGSPYTISATLSPAGVLSNYDISYNSASFTITKADPIVTATGNTCTYNGSPCPGSGSAKGVLGEDLTPVTLAYAVTPGPGNLLTSAPVTAGTYSMAARYAGDSNYNAKQSVPAVITINKKAASVTPDSKTKTYGGADPALTGALTGFVAADGITATYSRTAGENVAGSPYTISASLTPVAVLTNYDITYNTAIFTITKADPIVTVTGNTCTYDGTPCGGSGLAKGVLGEDLTPVTIAYAVTPGPGNLLTSAPITAGTYSVAARYAGDSNYNAKQSATATITINKRAASVTPDAKTKTYGSANPALTGTLVGFVARDGVTAEYSRTAGENVGGSPYTISATLSPAAALVNYDITYNTAIFTITKADPMMTALGNTCTYNGTPCAGTATAKGVFGEDLTPVTLAYSMTPGPGNLLTSAPIVAGTYSVAARYAGDANYNGKQSAPAAITINRQNASVSISDNGKRYGGTEPTLTGTLFGFVAADGISAMYSRAAGENAGVYTITPTLLDPNGKLGNYNVTVTNGTFTISKADPIVTATGNTCTYNGGPCPGSGSATGVFGETLTPVTVAYSAAPAPGNLLTSAPVNAGTYYVAARYAGDANYNAKQSAAAIIIIGKQMASVTPNDNGKTYGSSDPDPVTTGTLLGFVAADGVTATYSRTAGEGAGTYTIGAMLSPEGVLANYDITYNTATFTIAKADPVVTATGNTCTYTPNAPCTGSGSAKGVHGEDLTPVTLAYAVTPGPGNLLTSAPITAGTYSVAARYAGDTNYKGKQSAPATITINKAAATLTLSNLIQVYDGSPKSVTVTTDPAGLDGVSVTYNGSLTAPSADGSSPIVATLTNNNYSAANATGTFVILRADAGTPQTVDEAVVVTLNGTATSGIAFGWTQIAGPAVALSQSATLSPSFTAPLLNIHATDQIQSQVLTFRLTVTDFDPVDGTVSTSSTVNVTVVNVNHAPVAEPGSNQTVGEGSVVTLDGSNSYDEDGDTITYQWTQTSGPAVTLTNATSKVAAFTAPTILGGADNINATITLKFTLTVSDGALPNTSSEITVTVNQVNNAPTANAGPTQTTTVGKTVTLNGTISSDPDNDPISYTWTQTAGTPVTLNLTNPARPTFIAPAGPQVLTFKLVVSDGLLNSANQPQVNIVVADSAPVCTSAYPSANTLWPPDHRMVPVSILGVSDPDQQTTTIRVTGVTSDEPTNGQGDGDTAIDAVIQGGTVLLRSERSGNGDGRVYTVSFTADDGSGGTCSGKVKVGVPHDQGKGSTPIDSGQRYDATR